MTGMAVQLTGATIHRGCTEVVSRVDLDISAGEWVGLIGPNGAGKTSLLEGIAGLIPIGGIVKLLGKEIGGMSGQDRALRVAVVPQHPVLPPGMAVIDYVMLGRAPYLGRFGIESESDVVAANEAIEVLDLSGFALRGVDTLSGGERQRVVIARALAQAAPILLLDEPTSALDVGIQMDVLDRIDAIRRNSGLTVVSSVHDLTVAAQYCERLVMMSGGKVVADGDVERVLTPETIGTHFGARVRVIADDVGGVVVIPLRLPQEDDQSSDTRERQDHA